MYSAVVFFARLTVLPNLGLASRSWERGLRYTSPAYNGQRPGSFTLRAHFYFAFKPRFNFNHATPRMRVKNLRTRRRVSSARRCWLGLRGHVFDRFVLWGAGSNMAAAFRGGQQVVKQGFLWCMAAVYLFAFTSLYVQIPGKGWLDAVPYSVITNIIEINTIAFSCDDHWNYINLLNDKILDHSRIGIWK